MATFDLIFCGGNNQRLGSIAIREGFKYGCRLPNDKPFFPVYFADQNWKQPNKKEYMAALAKHRPSIATVLDWETLSQLDEVMSWAEEMAGYVDRVIVIPKVVNETHRIPLTIGGKSIVLGYSVPTRHGATPVPFWEFEGRDVHLLGGSPQRQMSETDYLACIANVVSVDGNMMLKMATSKCLHWTRDKSAFGHWQPAQRGENGVEEAFALSCRNISSAWDEYWRQKGVE